MYTTLIFFGIFLFPIPAILRCIRRGLNPYNGVLDGVVLVGLGTLMIFIYSSLTANGVAGEMEDAVNASLPVLLQSMPDQETAIRESFDLAISIFPSVILLAGAVTGYLEYLIFSKFVKNGEKGAWQMAKLREFSWPRNAVYGWLVMFLLSWITGLTGILDGDLVMVNIENLFQAAFALQGTSLLLMFCFMKRIPKGLAGMVAVLAWIIPFGKSILFLMGIADIMFGLRIRIGAK